MQDFTEKIGEWQKLSPGDRLRIFQRLHGRVYELAHALEMDSTSLYRYMRSDNMLGAEKLILLHHAGCSILWYLIGEGNPFSNTPEGHRIAGEVLRDSMRGEDEPPEPV